MAPVSELHWRSATTHHSTHIVQRGETLYAIAFRYDEDYRRLATFNRLSSPYALKIGQVLQLTSTPRYSLVDQPHHERPPEPTGQLKRSMPYYKPGTSSMNWVWPVKGQVFTRFIPMQGKKGIDIAGKKGDMVRASSDGVVAYAGNGIPGYSNLIIIKHTNQMLTAYGDNLVNKVKEGQHVRAGQVIAQMGTIDRKYWGVHFEIRKDGKPVNPLSYLQRN